VTALDIVLGVLLLLVLAVAALAFLLRDGDPR
jgi:hypothetical protein